MSARGKLPIGKRSAGKHLARAGLALLAAVAMLGMGCATAQKVVSRPGKSTVTVQCDAQVNDGLLLTLDLLLVNESESQQIRQTGREWFYSDLRRQLEPRTRTVSVEGGCRRTVEVEAQKGDTVLAIVADFRAPSSELDQGHMEFYERKEWKGKELTVLVHNTFMAVKEGR